MSIKRFDFCICPKCREYVPAKSLVNHYRNNHKVNLTPEQKKWLLSSTAGGTIVGGVRHTAATTSAVSRTTFAKEVALDAAKNEGSEDLRRCPHCQGGFPSAQMAQHICEAHTRIGKSRSARKSKGKQKRHKNATVPPRKTRAVEGTWSMRPAHPMKEVSTPKVEPSEVPRGQCRLCGRMAIAGDDVCYECSIR